MDSPRGPVVCLRHFSHTLGGKYIQLQAEWQFSDAQYQELALFANLPTKQLGFWSFTSDGKQSQGQLTEVKDIAADAFGFVAEMPAGLARQAYWPADDDGFYWAVEAKNKNGWKRFVEHHYHRV